MVDKEGATCPLPWRHTATHFLDILSNSLSNPLPNASTPRAPRALLAARELASLELVFARQSHCATHFLDMLRNSLSNPLPNESTPRAPSRS